MMQPPAGLSFSKLVAISAVRLIRIEAADGKAPARGAGIRPSGVVNRAVEHVSQATALADQRRDPVRTPGK
jgi:hypothetical protein